MLNTTQKKIRIAAYCRVSTKDEILLNSLENQIEYFLDIAQHHEDWELVGVYVDRGKTGTDQRKRASFQRLLRHCEAGKIDLVITKSISRFSRNTEELLGILRRLRSQNIEVIFEKEGIKTSQIDNDFVLSIYSALAQQEAVNIARNTEWGYEKRFAQGIPKFDPILGYNVKKDADSLKISIIPEEAELVKEIFNSYLQGTGLSQIARSMMERDILTKKGQKKWTPAYVTYILKNSRYLGSTTSIAPISNLISSLTGSTQRRGDIVIPDTHSPIIDETTFNEVQKKFESNKRTVNPKRKFPLSSRIVCGICGNNYALNYQFKDKRGWLCANRALDPNLCSSNRLFESSINHIMALASEKRFGLVNPNSIKHIHDLIKAIDETDNIEQQRITYYRRLKSAKSPTLINNIKEAHAHLQRVKDEFFDFETLASAIEEDRSYRQQAIGFLLNKSSENTSWDDFPTSIFRGWIRQVVIFSSTQAIIFWCDGTNTSIGNCPDEWPTHPIENKTEADKHTTLISTTTIKAKNQGILANRPHIIQKLTNAIDANHETTKLRVCAYCRVSTKEEILLNSIATQIAYYTNLILQNPKWEFAGIFTDIGVSGISTKNRTDFNKMLKACKQGKIDLIITKSVSRFSRNTLDCLEQIRNLKNLPNPVGVWFEQENIHSLSSSGEFTLALYSSMAQEEILGWGNSIQWGKLKKVERGIYPSGNTCYGYQRNPDSSWTIVPEEANIIRTIFNNYLSGTSTHKITITLAQNQILSPRGNLKWSSSAISRILRNDAYIGNLTYQKSYKKDPFSGVRVKNNGELDKYLFENHHEPIIEKNTWNQVQEKLTNQRNTLNTASVSTNQRTLHRVMFCSNCGNPLTILYCGTPNDRIDYIRCTVAFRRRIGFHCNEGSVREINVKHAFMRLLLHLKDNTNWWSDAEAQVFVDSMPTPLAERQSILSEKLERSYQKIHQLVQDHNVSIGTPSEELTQLVDGCLATKKELDKIESIVERNDYKKDLYLWFKSEITKLESFDPEQHRVLFRGDIYDKVVSHAVLTTDSKIVYNLIFGNIITIDRLDIKAWKIPLKE